MEVGFRPPALPPVDELRRSSQEPELAAAFGSTATLGEAGQSATRRPRPGAVDADRDSERMWVNEPDPAGGRHERPNCCRKLPQSPTPLIAALEVDPSGALTSSRFSTKAFTQHALG